MDIVGELFLVIFFYPHFRHTWITMPFYIHCNRLEFLPGVKWDQDLLSCTYILK